MEVKQLEVAVKTLMNSRLIRKYRNTFKGKGLEFDSYKSYTPEDDASIIDWKASLRSNNLLVKKFIEERKLNIFFLIDVSSTMIFGSTKKLKTEYVAEMTAALTYAMLHAEDKVGFAFFSDKVIFSDLPKAGEKQFYSLSRKILNPAFYGGDKDYNNALEYATKNLSDGAILFIISDFIGLRPNFEKDLRIASKKLDITGIMVRDPRDKTLPSVVGQIVVQDPITGKQEVIEPNLIKEDYAKIVKKQERSIHKMFKDTKCDFINLTTNQPFVKIFINYLVERAKKWR